MTKKWGPRAARLSGLVLLIGCVSGSIKQVKISNDMPSDLPQEYIQKFEVKEAGLTAPVRVIATPPPKKKEKTKKVKVDLPFSYPHRKSEKDPIWLNEKLVFSISYFGVSAGDFTLDILPFKVIDQRKVYHIRGNAISSPMFSLFYRLNDIVESYFDYQGNFSHRFHLVLDETKQKRDALELYDSEKKQTYYWNRWTRKDAGYTESKEFAPIEPFPQDSLSALYYIRTLPLKVGSVVSFPVVSEGKTWEAICTVLRREMVDSPFGRVQAIVIQPDTKFQGVLRKNGDSFLWLSDDERRFPLRLEAKVKVGVVVAALKKVELGTEPQVASASPTAGAN